MTPTRLREILDELHWSQRDLADLVGCNERLVRRWAVGKPEAPGPLADWLEERLTLHRRHPAPSWRQRGAA